MLLGTHRVAATESKDCNRLYLRKKTKRATSPTEDELFARIRFSTVAQTVNERRKDLSKITPTNRLSLLRRTLPVARRP
jgi:hypothetical protein